MTGHISQISTGVVTAVTPTSVIIRLNGQEADAVQEFPRDHFTAGHIPATGDCVTLTLRLACYRAKIQEQG
jgi:hypothetical protein